MKSNGWHWYTDGINNFSIRDNEVVPEGLVRGRAFSKSTREKLSESAIKRGPNNKGVRFSEQACKHMSDSKKRFLSEHPDWVSPSQWRKGNVPWNQGKHYTSEEKDHMRISRAKNCQKSLKFSRQERKFYNKLLNVFSKDDIVYQYTSDKYPYLCDFYIKSKDTYIECNFHWCHETHRFDPSSSEDIKLLQDYQEKAKTSEFYQCIVNVWAGTDVKKMQTARSNNLNYITVYGKDDQDAIIRRI